MTYFHTPILNVNLIRRIIQVLEDDPSQYDQAIYGTTSSLPLSLCQTPCCIAGLAIIHSGNYMDLPLSRCRTGSDITRAASLELGLSGQPSLCEILFAEEWPTAWIGAEKKPDTSDARRVLELLCDGVLPYVEEF